MGWGRPLKIIRSKETGQITAGAESKGKKKQTNII
jgi:hypothetical protein